MDAMHDAGLEPVDDRILKRLCTYTQPGALPALVVGVRWRGKPAGVAVFTDGVAFASGGMGGGSNSAKAGRVSLVMSSPRHGLLTVAADRYDIEFRSDSEAALFSSHLAALTAKHLASLGGGPLQVGPDERLIPRCTYLGGAYMQVQPGAVVDIAFREDATAFYLSPARSAREPLQLLPFAPSTRIDLTGPGKVTTGGRFVGGGFGLVGAVEGLAIAAMLNAMTTKITITTVMIIADHDHEAFFVNSVITPEEMRRVLSPVFVRIGRHHAAATLPAQQTVDDLISKLERLANLRSSGMLTDAQFEQAKAALLGGA